MIAKLFRLVGQIVGIHADAVAAYKTRHEFQEVPFRPCRLQHGFCVNAHFVENNGQLVHKRNINISLAVLYDLGRLRHLNGIGPVYANLNYQLIDFRNGLQCLLVHAGYNFGDRLQSMYLVARIDPFGRIADLEIHAAFKTRLPLQNRHTDILRHTGVHG